MLYKGKEIIVDMAYIEISPKYIVSYVKEGRDEDGIYIIHQLFGINIQASEDIYEVLLDKVQDYYMDILKKEYNKTVRDIYNC